MLGSKNYKLSAEEIALAMEGRNFSEQAIAIARRIFIDGETSYIKIADEFAVTRGRVYQIRDQFIAAYLEAATYPPGWERVTIVASPELIAQVTTQAEQERRAWLASKGGEPVKERATKPASKTSKLVLAPAKKGSGAAKKTGKNSR